MIARGPLVLALAFAAACGGGAAPSPQVSVLAPDAAVEVPHGALVEIRYVDDIAPDAGTTSLYADADGDPATEGDRVPISTGRAGAGGVEQVVPWDTGESPPGSYFLVALSERDGRAAAAVTPFAVLVNAPPIISLLAPAVETVVRPAGRLDITYVDDDPDDVAMTTLLLDGDGDPATTADQLLLVAARPDRDGGEQSAVAFLETVPDGLYFVLATTTDGKNAPVTAAAAGRVRVGRATISEIRGPAFHDTAQHVAAFADGSFVVAGQFGDTITFAEGTADETTLAADGTDVFLAKYDPRGRLAWARRVTGPGFESARGVWAFPDGSCALAGIVPTDGATTLGEGEPGEATVVAGPGLSSFFVGRYDALGTLLWARGGDPKSLAYVDGAAVLPGGALAVAISFGFRSLTLNAGLPDARTFDGGGYDVLLARYEADGRLGWVAQVGGQSAVAYLPRCAGHADGSAALSCVIQGSVTFGAGEANETTIPGGALYQVVLASYAPDGTLRWARRIRNDGGGGYWPRRIVAMPDGGAAVAGELNATTTFGPGDPNETTLPGGTPVRGFVARYAPDGTLVWARQIGVGGASFVHVTGLCASPGDVVVAGDLQSGAVTFGAGEPAEKTVVPLGLNLYFAHYAGDDGRFLGVWQFAPATDFLSGILWAHADVASFPDGSLVAAVTHGPVATFAPGTPEERHLATTGGTDIVLAVLDRATLDVISR